MTESQWNKEIVREWFRCVRDGDLDRLLVYMHPDVELHIPGSVIGGSYEGAKGVRSCFRRLDSVLEPGRQIEVNSLLGEDRMVFADTMHQGSFAEIDPFELHVFWLFSLRDRKIASVTLSFDTEELAHLAGQDTSTGEPAAA